MPVTRWVWLLFVIGLFTGCGVSDTPATDVQVLEDLSITSSAPAGSANSVLVISFARERLEEWGDPLAAALDAGFVRFRPVLMTALAMIIGMIPMALGLGEGGEQNAPLGRAVIGGLCFATVATLVIVPLVFSLVHTSRGSSRATSSSFGVKHV